jgi:adenine-specific DNA-methyltransferase
MLKNERLNMTPKEVFTEEGFSVIVPENGENRLLKFIKENYPRVIRDNEINTVELKNILGLPADEKTNGYGLNFVGRGVARAKYAQKTGKELKINESFSKNFDTTQNMVLKGDNLDCLKILKSHYGGKIKCIYIDPPYNTDSDEFVYPDKFDREEAEVLGLAGLSETDMERLEFSFHSKKSHNGWLSFMWPRLMLARDLLDRDGVIFISIDDNEQANLKLLCDEIFGEENFVNNFLWLTGKGKKDTWSRTTQQYILCFAKAKFSLPPFIDTQYAVGSFSNPDGDPRGPWFSGSISFSEERSNKKHPAYFSVTSPSGVVWTRQWQVDGKEEMDGLLAENRVYFGPAPQFDNVPRKKIFPSDEHEIIPSNRLDGFGTTLSANTECDKLFDMPPKKHIFDNPKPVELIKHLIKIPNAGNDITVMDFFAGSGTTGHAVMQLNSEDNGTRRFILCQIDEPVPDSKPACNFCVERDFPPVISSITTERLRRAGEKIKASRGLLDNDNLDIGFKVFDLIDAPNYVAPSLSLPARRLSG